MTGRDKHSSLLRYGIDCGRKKFYRTGPGFANSKSGIIAVFDKILSPVLLAWIYFYRQIRNSGTRLDENLPFGPLWASF